MSPLRFLLGKNMPGSGAEPQLVDAEGGETSQGLKAVLGAILAATLLATTATAQDRITADEFLDLAVGRTLTFHDFATGQPVGVEEYLNRNLSVWREEGRDCVYGAITIEEGKLCFLYDHDPDPACWWTFRDGDRLFVLYAELYTGEVQEVVKIVDAPLGCPLKPSV